jgi:hypothetical protein
LFDSDVPVIKETVFYAMDDKKDDLSLVDGYLNIDELSNKFSAVIVNATVQHGMYGTMRMRDIQVITAMVTAIED